MAAISTWIKSAEVPVSSSITVVARRRRGPAGPDGTEATMMMMTIDVTAQFAPVLWGIIAALGASACAVIAVADRAYAHERAIYVTLAAPSRAGIEQVDPVAVAPVTAL